MQTSNLPEFETIQTETPREEEDNLMFAKLKQGTAMHINLLMQKAHTASANLMLRKQRTKTEQAFQFEEVKSATGHVPLMKRLKTVFSLDENGLKETLRQPLDQTESSKKLIDYDFRTLAAQDSASSLLHKMQTSVPLDQLYRFRNTACTNELNQYCPVLLEVTNRKLQIMLNGNYLLQVWNKNRHLLFQQTHRNPVECMSIVRNIFAFLVPRNDSDEENVQFIEVVTLQPDSVQSIRRFKLNPIPFKISAISVVENIILIAREQKLFHACLSKPQEPSEALNASTLDFQSKDMSRFVKDEALRIIKFSEYDHPSRIKPGCVLICEDMLGNLHFFIVSKQADSIQIETHSDQSETGLQVFNSREEHRISDSSPELENKPKFASKILKCTCVMPQINQRVKIDRKYHKHFAVVLKSDFSIDLYYDFKKIESIKSHNGLLYLDFDLSFRELKLQMIDFNGEFSCKNIPISLNWMQKIGLSTQGAARSKLISDLIEEQDSHRTAQMFASANGKAAGANDQFNFEEIQLLHDAAKAASSFASEEEVLGSIQPVMKMLRKKQEGLHSLCADYVHLYSSFVNVDGQNICVVHNQFVSTFSMRYLRWTHHFDFGDQIRYLCTSKVEAMVVQELAVLVGFKQFRFLEFDNGTKQFQISSRQLNLDQVVSEIVSDYNCPGETYFICRNMKAPEKSTKRIGDTDVRNPPEPQSPNKFCLKALIKGKIKDLLSDDRLDLNSMNEGFRLWISKTLKCQQMERFIVIDYTTGSKQDNHFQIWVTMHMSKPGLRTELVELDYSLVEKLNDKVTDNPIDKRKGRLLGLIKTQKGDAELIQVTEDHILFLKEELPKLKVTKFMRDRNFKSMILLDDWIYSKTDAFKAYDNRPEVEWPVGPVVSSGFCATNLPLLIKGKVGTYKILNALQSINNSVAYHPVSEQFAFISSYNEMKVIPVPHKSALRFFGMGKKEDQLVHRIHRGTFTTVDKNANLTVWSTVTGKKIAQGYSSGQEEPIDGGHDLKNFEIYKSGGASDDSVWVKGMHNDKRSLSLVVSLQPSKVQEREQDLAQPEGAKPQEEKQAWYDFLLLVIENQICSPDDNRKEGEVVIRFDQQQCEKFSWRKFMSFKFKLAKKSGSFGLVLRPYIYLSEDTRKLMTYYTQMMQDNEQTDFQIYTREFQQNEETISWVPWKRVTRLPPILTSCSSFNYLFSPSFERYIDFDYMKSQIIVRDTADGEEVIAVPGSMFSLQMTSKKSMEDIGEIGTRIMMCSEHSLRLLNNDNIDVIIEYDEPTQRLNIKSFVAVDNLEGHKTKKHLFKDKQYDGGTEMLTKLVRQNAEFKQSIEHFRVEVQDRRLINEFMYEQMYSVDVFQQQYSSLMSFTILDWLVVQLLADPNSNIDFDSIDEKQLIQTCFNVFPRFRTMLHYLCSNPLLDKKEQHLQSIFEKAHTGAIEGFTDRKLNLPILRDDRGRTPIDIFLDQNSLNLNLADLMFQLIKDYPLLHSSHLLPKAIVKAIQHELPSIGQFLDARIKRSDELSNAPQFYQVCLDKPTTIMGREVRYKNFSILADKETIRSKLFKSDGYVQPLDLCYFDIPQINDHTKESSLIFEALAESSDLKIFDSLSVNITLDKAWHEHRKPFILFFLGPYSVLLLSFFFWTNWLAFYGPNSIQIFSEPKDHETVGVILSILIILLTFYFMVLEWYEMNEDPLIYIKNRQNLIDMTTFGLTLASVSIYLNNVRICQHEECINGLPDQIKNARGSELMYYVHASASVFLWFKLLYYLRMFEAISYIIRAQIEIVKGIKAFLIIFLVSTFAFSQGNYVTSKYHEFFGLGKDNDGELILFDSYFAAWLSSWEIMTGNQENLDLRASFLAFLIYNASLLFMLLAALNMLIARVDDLYGQVRDTQHAHVLRERAELINNVRSFPLSMAFTKKGKSDVFLFVAKTKEKQSKQMMKYDD